MNMGVAATDEDDSSYILRNLIIAKIEKKRLEINARMIEIEVNPCKIGSYLNIEQCKSHNHKPDLQFC